MKAQLTSRLEELRSELETGKQAKIDLENQWNALQQKIIYISGAIKVLEEELEKIDSTPDES